MKLIPKITAGFFLLTAMTLGIGSFAIADMPMTESSTAESPLPAQTHTPAPSPSSSLSLPVLLPPPFTPNVDKKNVLEFIDLSDLFSAYGNGAPVKVNRHKQVVGNRRVANHLPWPPEGSPYHTEALLWENGKVTVLNPRNSEKDLYTIATDINDRGQIVGYMEMPTPGIEHAFLWEKGKLIDLGTLPGMDSSVAQSINNAGEILVTYTGMWGQVGASAYWKRGKLKRIKENDSNGTNRGYFGKIESEFSGSGLFSSFFQLIEYHQ